MALAEFSKSKADCKPTFGMEMQIVDGVHPLLELNWRLDSIVPNRAVRLNGKF